MIHLPDELILHIISYLEPAALERLTRFVHVFPPLPRSSDPIPEAASKFRPTACIELAGKARYC